MKDIAVLIVIKPIQLLDFFGSSLLFTTFKQRYDTTNPYKWNSLLIPTAQWYNWKNQHCTKKKAKPTKKFDQIEVKNFTKLLCFWSTAKGLVVFCFHLFLEKWPSLHFNWPSIDLLFPSSYGKFQPSQKQYLTGLGWEHQTTKIVFSSNSTTKNDHSYVRKCATDERQFNNTTIIKQ